MWDAIIAALVARLLIASANEVPDTADPRDEPGVSMIPQKDVPYWRQYIDHFQNQKFYYSNHGVGYCTNHGLNKGHHMESQIPCSALSYRLVPVGNHGEWGEWPAEFVFDESVFRRQDENDDAEFHKTPRFVQHLANSPRLSLGLFYEDVAREITDVTKGGTIEFMVDIGASWTSHFSVNFEAKEVFGIGMNRDELMKNEKLHRFLVKDLNKDPLLPFSDRSVDMFVMALSVEYFIKPIELFKEMYRSLRPGGQAAITFSNKYFPTKAISIWADLNDVQRMVVVANYMHYAGFSDIECFDVHTLSKKDPLFAVTGMKKLDRDEL